MAQYSLFVLKVPLNTKQTNKQTNSLLFLHFFCTVAHTKPTWGLPFLSSPLKAFGYLEGGLLSLSSALQRQSVECVAFSLQCSDTVGWATGRASGV